MNNLKRTMWHLSWTKYFALLALLFAAGCSSTGDKTVLPQDGATMADIYHQQMQKAGQNQVNQARHAVDSLPAASANLTLVTRGQLDIANQESSCAFPKLPNPAIQMYVYPHLAGENLAPVPGYTTEFTLYETTYYAQPGEVGIC